MSNKSRALGLLALILSVATTSQAASVYLSPASASFDLSAGQASFEVFMNFASSEATVGGGVDIQLTGPISFLSFTPSAWFGSVPDSQLSGHGRTLADHDYEVHFSSFNAMSGLNALGTLTVRLNGSGVGTIALLENSLVGPFASLSAQAIPTTLSGAQFSITAVPEPDAAWLMVGGLALVAMARRPVRPT